MRDCGIATTSQTRPVCKHCFSALPIDKTSSVEAQIEYYGVVVAHLATGCGIKAKDPEGLDSDRWIPLRGGARIPRGLLALAGFSHHLSTGFTDLNPAPRESPSGILAPPLSGIHRSESSPSGSFALERNVACHLVATVRTTGIVSGSNVFAHIWRSDTQSSNKSHSLDYMTGYKGSSPSYAHRGMMMSSNGNLIRFTGLMCGEFTGHRWIPSTKVSDAELWCFLWSAPYQTVA